MKNEVIFGILFVIMLGVLGYMFLTRSSERGRGEAPVAPPVRADVVETPPALPPPPAPPPPVMNETGEPFPREVGPRQRRAPVMEAPDAAPPKPDPAPAAVAPPPPEAPKQRPHPASTIFFSDRATPPKLVLRGEEVPPEKLDEIMVWGTDPDSLKGSIQEQHEEFVRCYDAWLAVEPNLAGRMKLGFTIGRATEEDSLASVIALDVVDSELDHAVFEGCIIGALQDLTYDLTDGNIVVNYPLNFRRDEEE